MPNQSLARRMRPHEDFRWVIMPTWSGLQLENLGQEYRIKSNLELCQHEEGRGGIWRRSNNIYSKQGETGKITRRMGGRKGRREEGGEGEREGYNILSS